MGKRVLWIVSIGLLILAAFWAGRNLPEGSGARKASSTRDPGKGAAGARSEAAKTAAERALKTKLAKATERIRALERDAEALRLLAEAGRAPKKKEAEDRKDRTGKAGSRDGDGNTSEEGGEEPLRGSEVKYDSPDEALVAGLGLDPAHAAAFLRMLEGMRKRMLDLQDAHSVKTIDGDVTTIVVSRYPDEAKALDDEWDQSLRGILTDSQYSRYKDLCGAGGFFGGTGQKNYKLLITGSGDQKKTIYLDLSPGGGGSVSGVRGGRR